MPVTIREAKVSDIDVVAHSIRWDDTIEIFAQGYAAPTQALAVSFGISEYRFTLEKDGQPIAMFGLVPETKDNDKANIWLLGTSEISTVKKTFCKLSKIIIDQFLSKYPVLSAQVDSRYQATHRWLEWLGAKKGTTYKMDTGIDFNDFVFERRA